MTKNTISHVTQARLGPEGLEKEIANKQSNNDIQQLTDQMGKDVDSDDIMRVLCIYVQCKVQVAWRL